MSGTTIEWEVDDGSAVVERSGPIVAYSNCFFSFQGVASDGTFLGDWENCGAVPDHLNVDLKAINPYDVSRSLTEVVSIEEYQPPVSFRTQPNFETRMVELYFQGSSIDLSDDNCELRVFLDGQSFDVIQTGTTVVLGDNGLEVVCIGLAFVPVVSYSMESLGVTFGKVKKKVGKNASRPSTYTLQLCDVDVSTPDPASCSASHLLPLRSEIAQAVSLP